MDDDDDNRKLRTGKAACLYRTLLMHTDRLSACAVNSWFLYLLPKLLIPPSCGSEMPAIATAHRERVTAPLSALWRYFQVADRNPKKIVRRRHCGCSKGTCASIRSTP